MKHESGFAPIALAEALSLLRSMMRERDTIADIAGDLWNALEHLHESWQDTDDGPRFQQAIDAYEKWAGVGLPPLEEYAP